MYNKPMRLDRQVMKDILPPAAAEGSKEADLFGLEVELEGRSILTQKASVAKFWTMHNDGSLRRLRPEDEMVEYVFTKGFNMETTKLALKTLFYFLTTKPAEVFDSYRTSIHVHVNCLHESWRTVYNFMTLAIIFDELLTSQNGEHRVGNNFCLRFRDAEGAIDSASQSIRSTGNIFNLIRDHRYSSVNFASLLRFGTIEFRSLECTTDYDRVVHWVETLQAMKEAARMFTDPTEIIGAISRFGAAEFVSRVLGPNAAKYLVVPNYPGMLTRGMRLAQDFAYSASWKAADEKTYDKHQKASNPAVEIREDAFAPFVVPPIRAGRPFGAGTRTARPVPFEQQVEIERERQAEELRRAREFIQQRNRATANPVPQTTGTRRLNDVPFPEWAFAPPLRPDEI